jgi:hybrid polyketide synthase / nonribosomal peptide synthetase ACE1
VEAGEGMFLSEQDFHQLFAEVVLAGQPGKPGPIEISTGLRTVGFHDEVKPSWASNPMMSHLLKNNDGKEVFSTNSMSKVSVKTKFS